jgi:hypothetical protein
VSPGKLAVNAGGITSNELASGAVTTNAIADGAVTPAKLATGGPAWSGTTGSIVIKQPALELGEGITSNNASLIDFHSVHPLTDYETRITRDSGVDGWFAIANQGAGRISFSSAGGFQFANAPMPNPVGTAPIFGVRAWVNFDATRDSSGATNALNTNRFIRSSGNVTSVKKDSTGRYTVTFTTAFENTNYTVICSAGNTNSPRVASADRATATGSSIQIETDDTASAVETCTENSVMVIG